MKCLGPGTLHNYICSKATHSRASISNWCDQCPDCAAPILSGLGAGLVSTAHGKGSTKFCPLYCSLTPGKLLIKVTHVLKSRPRVLAPALTTTVLTVALYEPASAVAGRRADAQPNHETPPCHSCEKCNATPTLRTRGHNVHGERNQCQEETPAPFSTSSAGFKPESKTSAKSKNSSKCALSS